MRNMVPIWGIDTPCSFAYWKIPAIEVLMNTSVQARKASMNESLLFNPEIKKLGHLNNEG